MFQIERINKELEYINLQGRASINELSALFSISKVTARADVNELVRKKLVTKTHGGVMSLAHRGSMEIPWEAKYKMHAEAKRKIGRKAAKFIEDNDVVILDAGSTTLEVVRYISAKNVTIITNDIYIGVEVAKAKNKMKLIVAGGELEDSVYTLIGENTVKFFSWIRADKVFLGCDAYDLDFGISNRTMREVSVKQAMMKAGGRVFALTDSAKLNKQVCYKICNPFDVKEFIVEKIDPNLQAMMEAGGVAVHMADA